MNEVVNKVLGTLGKHSPTILTGLAITGVVSTAIFAAKVTPKACQLLDEAEAKKGEELTLKEEFLTVWKLYIPCVVMGSLTILCIVGANSINLKRNAAIAGAYSLAEAGLKEYQAKVIETIGEKKAQGIVDSLRQDRVNQNPPTDNSIIFTGSGETLCYDSISGRYFKSDMETIRKKLNDMNIDLIRDNYVSLNEMYDELGLPHTKLGDNMGWCVDQGTIAFDYSSALTPDGRPCLVLDYIVGPFYGYRGVE